jgi:hypothetical protein
VWRYGFPYGPDAKLPPIWLIAKHQDGAGSCNETPWNSGGQARSTQTVADG